ncbi:MAG: HAD-IG family 5'-nucleotidase [Deltaproteobacteria bacterium]|nr:HAD-IG family 5'-nucleotidase [Deltaproteobacteria bacterium]
MTRDLSALSHVPRERGVFCNRTLNLRSIKAIGYDMDYTLIDYHVEAWERRAYEHLRRKLVAYGWPVGDLEFDPTLIQRGLILDIEHGNLLKANRFGYVKRAYHGTQPLDFDEQRQVYSRIIVDLSEPRWVFLNTLFSLSEACMYAQLVDLLDQGKIAQGHISGVLGYADLYKRVRKSLDLAHMEGQLKADILAEPETFIQLDSDTPLALLDQRHAGKKLLLITNSEWEYTRAVMRYCFDRFLPGGMTWRDLFDVLIVSARKPAFFSSRMPLFEVVSEDGLLRPAMPGLTDRGIFLGGDATQVEEYLGLSGDQILYVGDHIFVDVQISKNVLRWRTALVVRELEQEVRAMEHFRDHEGQLTALMAEKEQREGLLCHLRLLLQRAQGHYGPPPTITPEALHAEIQSLRAEVEALDDQIAPLAIRAGDLSNHRWGLLMRAGNDKSYMARQLERHADVYTSRVSNFVFQTPFAFIRSHRGSLPHDGTEG